MWKEAYYAKSNGTLAGHVVEDPEGRRKVDAIYGYKTALRDVILDGVSVVKDLELVAFGQSYTEIKLMSF